MRKVLQDVGLSPVICRSGFSPLIDDGLRVCDLVRDKLATDEFFSSFSFTGRSETRFEKRKDLRESNSQSGEEPWPVDWTRERHL